MTNQTRTNFQRLAQQYLAPRWVVLALGGVFVTLSNLCSAYYPRIIGQTVDTIARGAATWESILGNITAVLLLTIGSGMFMFATRKTVIVTSRKIEYELRRDFLAALERQSQRFYDRMPTGVLMAHATNDIAAVREFLGPAIMYSANTLTTFAFVLVLMLSIDPLVTACALLPLPFVALSTYRIGKRIYSASRHVQEEFSELVRHAQEAFSGIRIIRAFVREGYEESLFTTQSNPVHYEQPAAGTTAGTLYAFDDAVGWLVAADRSFGRWLAGCCRDNERRIPGTVFHLHRATYLADRSHWMGNRYCAAFCSFSRSTLRHHG